MSTTTIRLITTALLALAVTAPIASARPVSAYPPPPWVQTDQQDGRRESATGTASSPRQDLRNSDNRAARPEDAKRRHTAPVAIPPVQAYPRAAGQVTPLKAQQQPAPATDDGPSPFVYIIPSVVLIGLLGAGFAFVRASRSGRPTATSA